MTTIFISHSSRDDEFVDKLAISLNKHQFNTWVDHKDTPDGMLWANIIQEGLEKGEHMILIVSESSMQSRHVRIEWQSFQGLVKPIILIILEENIQIPKLLQDFPSVYWSNDRPISDNIDNLLKFLPTPGVSTTAAESLLTKQLNPDVSGLDELQSLVSEIEVDTTHTQDTSDVKFVIPKSDVSIQYQLNQPMTIGRASPHDSQKPDIDLNPYESIKTVSRNHAMISIDKGKIVLTDTGSSNGTFVDGKRLEANVPTRIDSGTMVRFGALIVQILQGS